MVRREAVFFLLGLALAGCAGFGYRYYGLDGIDYDNGRLLGDKPEHDRPLSDCKPTAENPHPCTVMFYKGIDGFLAMKTEMQDCKNRLKTCEKTCKN